jgi:pectate lyase
MKRILLFGGVIAVCLFCCASAVFAADGYGANVTGGAGGPVVTVSTAADFKTYVELAGTRIVQVSGTINLTPIGYKVYIASNKTIRGIDTNSKIIGNLAFQQYANNVIIERLTITNPTYGEDHSDGISVKENVTNVFITHCTFYDCGDGCLDTTEESDFITVSWCKFYYVALSVHNNVCLVGHVDTNTDDIGKLHITFHHNWWSTKCMERMPRVRYGRAHVYNNYYSCTSNTYCVGVGVGCQIRLENNYFDNVNQTWKSWNTAGYTPGRIGWNSGATGNQFVNGTTPATWAPNDYNNVFTPPYSYLNTMDDGPNVKSIVMAGAGISGGDAAAPAAPTGLTVIPGEANVPLDWNNNGEGDLAGYYVYRSTNSGPPYSRLNSTPLTNSDYIDNITTHDTTYYYVVTAVDTNLNESDYSSEVFGGLYGDFTGNGIVEIDDLPDFLDFWLETDCGLTDGLDLDDNCIVNFYEFSVLGNNWRK